jgi:hypothetical protein
MQLRPQAPQLAESLLRSTQLPEQAVCPAAQARPQTPALQVSPAAQAWLHIPQWSALVCTLVHAPEHMESMGRQGSVGPVMVASQ